MVEAVVPGVIWVLSTKGIFGGSCWIRIMMDLSNSREFAIMGLKARSHRLWTWALIISVEILGRMHDAWCCKLFGMRSM